MDSAQKMSENSKLKLPQSANDMVERQAGSDPENVSVPTKEKPIPKWTGGFTENESRASRLSTVERRIIKDSDECPECRANNDPRNVPVHPNCHCNVVTDGVETGNVDPESSLLQTLTEDIIEIVMPNGTEAPGAIQVNPDTVSVFDPENVRYADLARWLEQMEPYLNAANNYISIIVDEDTDEAAANIEEALTSIAEGTTEISEQLFENKKLWFSIAQAVV